MEFKELVTKNRSYRRYDQSHPISKETLQALVELARYCPSGANRQSLRFIGSISPEMNEKIFNTLGWAAYLPEWPGPSDGQRPTGYIVILADPSEWKWVMADLGIVAQTILLEAVNRGLGGCMIGNIKIRGDQRGIPISLKKSGSSPVFPRHFSSSNSSMGHPHTHQKKMVSPLTSNHLSWPQYLHIAFGCSLVPDTTYVSPFCFND